MRLLVIIYLAMTGEGLWFVDSGIPTDIIV